MRKSFELVGKRLLIATRISRLTQLRVRYTHYVQVSAARLCSKHTVFMVWLVREAYCDMKIKEKGHTGKAADLHKDSISSSKGFNAFRETEKPLQIKIQRET